MLVIIAWLVLLPQRWTLMKPFVVSSCSWFVFPFSFLKSWERTDVGFSTILTIIITFIWEGRQLLTCYHCSSTYVNRNPSMPGAAWGGVLTTVPVPRELSAQPMQEQTAGETYEESLCRSLGEIGSGEGKSIFSDLKSQHEFTVAGQSQPAPQ